jgi:RimJ/RimL family protein N-acetyltransferase
MSNSSASIAVHGPTLMLRLPRAGDAAALLELAGDPEVTRWFSWGPYRTIEEPRAWLGTLDDRRARGEQLDLLIVHRDQGPAGVTGLGELSVRDRRCMVGTWLGRRFWGTGVNREAKALVAHLAFAVLGMHRLGCYANPANARSTRAVLGVGFRREGLLRHYHRHGDAHLDVEVFGMLRGDWHHSPLSGVPVRVEGDPPPAFVVD